MMPNDKLCYKVFKVCYFLKLRQLVVVSYYINLMVSVLNSVDFFSIFFRNRKVIQSPPPAKMDPKPKNFFCFSFNVASKTCSDSTSSFPVPELRLPHPRLLLQQLRKQRPRPKLRRSIGRKSCTRKLCSCQIVRLRIFLQRCAISSKQCRKMCRN